MRIISYDEFVFNIKKDDSYNNELLPLIEKDNSILSVLISRKVKKCSFLFFYAEHGINTLEVLFYEGYITKEDVINSFNSIAIDSQDVYKRIYQYAVMYDYRRDNPIFPFKLHIDTDFLKEKLKNAPKQFKVENIEFKYNLDYFTSQDYDELMLYYREPSNMNDFKSALLENPIACVLGQKPDRRDDYPGFTQVWLLMYYLQIFIDDGLITNNQINMILSEIDITNIDWFIHVEEYLRNMLRLNKFKWHRYTLDIDVNMLQNKVEGAFNTSITEEKGGIRKEHFLNLYNILDSPLKFDKTPQQRHELDMSYREKYRKLYEAELKEKAN
ncbi:MAG: hypothetical protein IKB64_04365, partial [Paludibacteraceae bacterium]|nr:hypothetical protein [Paludibacteraceae bacterium]